MRGFLPAVSRTKNTLHDISILDCTPSPTLFALASHNRVECSSRLEHLTVYDLAHSSFADGTNHAARFVVVGIFKCARRYLGLYTFWHSMRSIVSPSPSVQLEIGTSYGVWYCAFFICWWHFPCCSFRGPRNFQVRLHRVFYKTSLARDNFYREQIILQSSKYVSTFFPARINF